jgi:hypothetical protein
VSIDPRLEHIFEAWFDYDHAVDEDAKAHNKQKRADLIMSAMRTARLSATVGEFLHSYRDDYRDWAARKLLSTPRRRF